MTMLQPKKNAQTAFGMPRLARGTKNPMANPAIKKAKMIKMVFMTTPLLSAARFLCSLLKGLIGTLFRNRHSDLKKNQFAYQSAIHGLKEGATH